MPVHSEWVTYGQGQRGYLAWPDRAAGPLPSVLVIQEVWGVEGQIEDVTRRVAASGYVALAPDLFSSLGPRPEALSAGRIAQAQAFAAQTPPGALFDPSRRDAEFAKLPEPDRTLVADTFRQIFQTPQRLPEYLEPLRQAVDYLKHRRPQSLGAPLASVGFCMGGGLSALLSCEDPEVDAAAVFYGMSPPAEAVARGQAPILGFYAGNDLRVNATLPAFEEAMAAAGRAFEARIYPGTNHAFFNETGAAYDVGAARDSWVRLLTFFQERLVP